MRTDLRYACIVTVIYSPCFILLIGALVLGYSVSDKAAAVVGIWSFTNLIVVMLNRFLDGFSILDTIEKDQPK